MIELVEDIGGFFYDAERIFMHLYCDQHRMNHALSLDAVEKVIYALGAAEACARNNDQIPAESPDDFGTTCPVEVLRSASDAQLYVEHVEDSVTSRKGATNGSRS